MRGYQSLFAWSAAWKSGRRTVLHRHASGERPHCRRSSVKADPAPRGNVRFCMGAPGRGVCLGPAYAGVVHLGLVAVVVSDYDPAIRFFVDALGFELAEDSPSLTNDGRPKRWVVVRPQAGWVSSSTSMISMLP